MPKLFIVATTFWPILPLFPTPTITSFPPEQIDAVIAFTELASPSWATLLVSYSFSSPDRASRSVLITCSAVANASLLQNSSMDFPASDRAAGDSGEVGVRGSWYSADEVIFESHIMNGDLGECYACDEDRDGGYVGTRASLGFQNIIVMKFPRSRRPSEVYHFM